MRCRRSLKVSRSREPDPVPDVVGQRLGGDHQRVDRRDGAPQAGQPRGEPLGRADDHVGADRDRAGVTATRGSMRGDRGPLVERDAAAAPPRGPARAPAAPGGWRRSAVCTSHRARSLACSRVARLVGAEQREVVLAEAPLPGLARPRPARGPAAPASRAATTVPPFAKWQSMPSAAATARRPRRRCPAWRGAGRPRARGRTASPASDTGAGNSAEHQPPLRPLAPNPATSRLQHGDPQRRVGRRQVVRGPQPGVAGADDRHVDVEVAGQRRPRRRVVVGGVVPEREPAVVGHDGLTRGPRRDVRRAPGARHAGPAPARLAGHLLQRHDAGPDRQRQVLVRVLGRAVAHLHRPLRRAAARAPASRRAPCGSAAGRRPTGRASGAR